MIVILTKVFYTSGPNLLILAWTGGELWCGEARGWHTDMDTDIYTDTRDTGRQRQYPKAKTGLR